MAINLNKPPNISEIERSGDYLKVFDTVKTKRQTALDKGDTAAVAYFDGLGAELKAKRESSDFEWDEEDFGRNKPALENFRSLYKIQEGKDFNGSDEELADEFKGVFGWFDYNLPSMTKTMFESKDWSPEERTLFLKSYEDYEKLDLGTASTAKLVGKMALDPSTWLGIGTFGIGTVAKAGTKKASIESFKMFLRKGLPKTTVGKVAAAEGAIGAGYGLAHDANLQEIEDPDAAYDVSRGLVSGAIPGVAGALIGGGGAKLIQGKRFSTGTASKGDFVDKAFTDNNAVKSAHGITNNAIRRLEDKVGSIFADAGNKGTDWVKTKLSGVPGIGKELSEAADTLAKKFGEGPADSPAFKKELMGLLRAKFDVASGSKFFGSGTAPLRVQKHKTQLARGVVKLGTGAATSGITTAAKVIPRAVKGILSPVNQAKAEKLAWGKTTADLPPIKTDAEVQAQGNALYRQQQLLNTNPQVQNVRAGGAGVTPVGRPQNAPGVTDADISRPGDSITRIAAPHISAPDGVFKRDLVDSDKYRHFTSKGGDDKFTVRVPKSFKGTDKDWLALSRDERITERWKAEGSPKFTIGNSEMSRSEILQISRVFSDYYFKPDASSTYAGAHRGSELFSGITVKPGAKLSTTGHETGHSMDSFLNRDTVQSPIDDLGAPRGPASKGLTTTSMGVPKALGVDLFDEMMATMKTARGPRATDSYIMDQIPAEGIADGFRLMMTHPKQFKSKHPEMYAYLDGRLRSDEVVKQFLEDTVKRGIDIKLAAKWAIALGATLSTVNAVLEGDK